MVSLLLVGLKLIGVVGESEMRACRQTSLKVLLILCGVAYDRSSSRKTTSPAPSESICVTHLRLLIALEAIYPPA